MAIITSGAPTSKTTGNIGDHLVDSTTRKVYECIAVNTYGGHDAVTFKQEETEYVWKCIGDDPNYGSELPSGGSQADWNVTDSNDPAFIKNKPFGVEKGAVIRSVSGLSWSENTGYKKDEYQYKSDVDTNVFKTFDEIPNVNSGSTIQVVVDGVAYSNMVIIDADGGGAYERHVYSEECPVYIITVNAYMADTVTVTFLSNRTDINSVQVIDLGKDSIKAMSSDYIEFASTTSGSSKKFKITVDDSGAISATEVT